MNKRASHEHKKRETGVGEKRQEREERDLDVWGEDSPRQHFTPLSPTTPNQVLGKSPNNGVMKTPTNSSSSFNKSPNYLAKHPNSNNNNSSNTTSNHHLPRLSLTKPIDDLGAAAGGGAQRQNPTSGLHYAGGDRVEIRDSLSLMRRSNRGIYIYIYMGCTCV